MNEFSVYFTYLDYYFGISMIKQSVIALPKIIIEQIELLALTLIPSVNPFHMIELRQITNHNLTTNSNHDFVRPIRQQW